MNTIITKGLLLGFTAGLITTFFDRLLMLSTFCIPSAYPFHVIVFNTLFWTILGGLSSISSWIANRKIGGFAEKEDLYWIFFFLIPFALLYGTLGRLYIPVYIWFVNYGAPVFDHHLSFVWAGLMMVFLVAYLNKRKSQNYVSSNYSAAELISV